MRIDRWTVGLAGFFALLAAAMLFVWIPNDIETGIVEVYRRQVNIGDSMAPTVAAVGLLIVSLLMGVLGLFRPALPSAPPIDNRSFSFLGRTAGVSVLSLVIMVYAGPLFVWIVNLFGDVGIYRHLKDDFPYKYVGFVLGGGTMVAGMIMVVENRLSRRSIWIAAAAVLALIAIFDLPFDDILLPPNGDY